MHEPQIVKQYKQVHENSFFPLFTATTPRVQTSQDLYYSRPPSTYHPPRRAYSPSLYENTRQAYGLQLSPWGRAGDKIATLVAIWEP